MNNETERYLEMLDRRIGLLGTLAESFVEVRADIICLDVSGLEARIAQQEQLCLSRWARWIGNWRSYKSNA